MRLPRFLRRARRREVVARPLPPRPSLDEGAYRRRLEDRTLESLRGLARDWGIKNVHRYRKADLVDAIIATRRAKLR